MSEMISEIPVGMVINTGASIDILDETAYLKVNYSGKITLQPSTKRLFAYGLNHNYMLLVVLNPLSDSGTITQFLHCMC